MHILLILLCLASLAASAPSPNVVYYDTSSSIATPTTTFAPPTSPRFSIGDYAGDHELDGVIERLREQTSIVDHADNFVSDDMPLEEVLRLIESAERVSTQLPNSQETSDSSTTTRRPTRGVITISDSVIWSPSGIELESRVLPSSTSSTTEGPEECPICYEPLRSKQMTLTECAHKFHQDCLDSWKASGVYPHTCPVCRHRIHI